MSRFIFKILTTVALVVGSISALENGVLLSETFGGPHGDKYSDLRLVDPGQTVQAITIRSAERVDAVILDVTDPSGQHTTLHHGGYGGDVNTLKLGTGEYITRIEAHWGKAYGHTRIMYIEFTTNTGNITFGGTPTQEIGKDSAPEGYQLGGFVGTSVNELDSVGAIRTSIMPVE